MYHAAQTKLKSHSFISCLFGMYIIRIDCAESKVCFNLWQCFVCPIVRLKCTLCWQWVARPCHIVAAIEKIWDQRTLYDRALSRTAERASKQRCSPKNHTRWNVRKIHIYWHVHCILFSININVICNNDLDGSTYCIDCIKSSINCVFHSEIV